MLSHNLKLKTVFCLILIQVELVRISLRYEKKIYIYIKGHCRWCGRGFLSRALCALGDSAVTVVQTPRSFQRRRPRPKVPTAPPAPTRLHPHLCREDEAPRCRKPGSQEPQASLQPSQRLSGQEKVGSVWVSAPGTGFIHREPPQPPGILMMTGPSLQAAGAVVEVAPRSLAGGRGSRLSIAGES